MHWNAVNRMVSRRWVSLVIIVVSLLVLAGCSSEEANTPIPHTAPDATLTPASLENPATTSPPTPDLTASEPVTLKILAPQHGVEVEVGVVRVRGSTSGTRASINGVPVKVSSEGTFQRDLPLAEGLNMVEVVAWDQSGRTASQKLAVISTPTIDELPFSLFYPPDGLMVTESEVAILGATNPDAIVAVIPVDVDGIFSSTVDLVDVNALGIFSSTVDLVAGPNLVEVVITDILGNTRFQTVAIFYTP